MRERKRRGKSGAVVGSARGNRERGKNHSGGSMMRVEGDG